MDALDSFRRTAPSSPSAHTDLAHAAKATLDRVPAHSVRMVRSQAVGGGSRSEPLLQSRFRRGPDRGRRVHLRLKGHSPMSWTTGPRGPARTRRVMRDVLCFRCVHANKLVAHRPWPARGCPLCGAVHSGGPTPLRIDRLVWRRVGHIWGAALGEHRRDPSAGLGLGRGPSTLGLRAPDDAAPIFAFTISEVPMRSDRPCRDLEKRFRNQNRGQKNGRSSLNFKNKTSPGHTF